MEPKDNDASGSSEELIPHYGTSKKTYYEPPPVKQYYRFEIPKGVSPILAVIIMVAITVILAAILYVWASGFIGGGGDYRAPEDLGKQEVPAEPIEMEISTILDVKYVDLEDEKESVYTVQYSADFKYEKSINATTYLPLPTGSVEDINVLLNGKIIKTPLVISNSIKIELPDNRENNIKIEYTAQSYEEYNHAIPKNRMISRFYLKIEINGIDYDETLPQKCLLPDKTTHSDDKTIYIWDKKNAVLKRDILINMPEWKEPYEDYKDSFGYFFLLFFLLGLFYYDASKKMKLSWKIENLSFLIAPLLIFYIVLGFVLLFIDLIISMIIAIISCLISTFIAQRMILKIPKKYYELLLIPSFALIFVSFLVFASNTWGMSIGIISLLMLLFFVLNYFKKYELPIKEESIEDVLKKLKNIEDEKKILEDEKEKNEKVAWEVVEENELLKKQLKESEEITSKFESVVKEKEKIQVLVKETQEKIESLTKGKYWSKKFCPYCSCKITEDFIFCPKCGENIKNVGICEKCSALISGKEKYCPNCGINFGDENKIK